MYFTLFSSFLGERQLKLGNIINKRVFFYDFRYIFTLGAFFSVADFEYGKSIFFDNHDPIDLIGSPVYRKGTYKFTAVRASVRASVRPCVPVLQPKPRYVFF